MPWQSDQDYMDWLDRYSEPTKANCLLHGNMRPCQRCAQRAEQLQEDIIERRRRLRAPVPA
jgi:hypothetical protein